MSQCNNTFSSFPSLVDQPCLSAYMDVQIDNLEKRFTWVGLPLSLSMEYGTVNSGWCRYEVEKSLLDGSLTVEEVPRVWNEKMEEYLGAKPQDDSEGCLQDLVIFL